MSAVIIKKIRGMPRTLTLIPDAGCTDPFHIQRTQKPGSKESGFSLN